MGRYAANPLGQPIGGHGIGPWEKGREGGPWNNPWHVLRTGVAWRVGKEPPKKRLKKGQGNKTKGARRTRKTSRRTKNKTRRTKTRRRSERDQ